MNLVDGNRKNCGLKLEILLGKNAKKKRKKLVKRKEKLGWVTEETLKLRDRQSQKKKVSKLNVNCN